MYFALYFLHSLIYPDVKVVKLLAIVSPQIIKSDFLKHFLSIPNVFLTLYIKTIFCNLYYLEVRSPSHVRF